MVQCWFGNKDILGKFYVYILRCVGDVYYVGQTEKLIDRMFVHIVGYGAAFTKLHPPCELVHLEIMGTRGESEKREAEWRSMVRNGNCQFSLPVEFEDFFYRIMAMVSRKDLSKSPIKQRGLQERCREMIVLPDIQCVSHVNIKKQSKPPVEISIYKDGEKFTFSSQDEIPADLMEWINETII